MLKKSGTTPMAVRPAGANISMDTRMALLEDLCRSLQQRLQDHEDFLESVFKPDGSIELRSAHKLEIVVGSSRISIDPMGIQILTPLNVTVNTTKFEINAGAMPANVALANVTGIFKSETIACRTMMAESTVSQSYTPGAGNIW